MIGGGIQDFGTGPGGPMISGKWINRLTGNIINVRDSIINGDEMVLITDKGQVSMDDFSRNYVQASTDIYDDKGNIIGQEEIDPNDIVMSSKQINNPKLKNAQQLGGDIQEDDMSQIMSINNTEVNALTTPVVPVQTPKAQEPQSEKVKLIKTIFDKCSQPEINLDIEWAAFPKNELEMLMNYFGVTQEEIAEYISNSIEKSTIVEAVNKFLMGKFMN
jgi:hypothetical protein